MTQRVGLIIGVIVLIGAMAFLVPDAYRRHVITKGAALAGEKRACLFVGNFSASGVPVARLIGEGEAWIQPWADFSDRFLAAEPAKPFHFGMIILHGDGTPPQILGWSYRTTSFWTDNRGVFDLAYRGNVSTDCQASE